MNEAMTVREQGRFNEYLGYLRARGRKDLTLKSYTDAHRAFCEYCRSVDGKAADITELTGLDVRGWKTAMLASRAPTTTNHRLFVIKSYFRWACMSGIVPSSRLEAVEAVPEVPTQRLGAVTLPPDALRRFLKSLELSGDKRDQAIVHLLLSGLRLSELVGLEVIDVSVSINQGKLEIHGEHVKRSGHRVVPLGRTARLALKSYLEAEKPMGRVFWGQRGPLTASGVDKIVRKYGSQVGLHTHAHLMRHQYSESYLVANPGDLVGLQTLLGHGSIETTARHYARKRFSDLELAVERITN